MKWRLKSCPRCGGDIMVYDDLDGWQGTCLQCGYNCRHEDLKVLLCDLEQGVEKDYEVVHTVN